MTLFNRKDLEHGQLATQSDLLGQADIPRLSDPSDKLDWDWKPGRYQQKCQQMQGFPFLIMEATQKKSSFLPTGLMDLSQQAHLQKGGFLKMLMNRQIS